MESLKLIKELSLVNISECIKNISHFEYTQTENIEKLCVFDEIGTRIKITFIRINNLLKIHKFENFRLNIFYNDEDLDEEDEIMLNTYLEHIARKILRT
jgi:hypothetical protein